MREEDSLSAERYASSLRLLATWESIALKYADIDPEDDAEIDIATGRIVRGKDRIAEMPDRVIGGMSDEEEAEEFRRKGKSSIKLSDSTAQAIAPVDFVEHIVPPVLPLTLDPEDDFSDKDELDAWNDDDLEIQVEALPPSHTSSSRHQRPWTADDDLDLREFLKAEERRKAMFGEEEAAEEAEIEQESRSQVGRVLDKEEAMSRRTVHASVPYFATDPSAPLSRSSFRSKGGDSLSKPVAFSARTTSHPEAIAQADVDSAEEFSAGDELAEMLETSERSQDLRIRSRHANAIHPQPSSPLVLDMLGVRNVRPSSPSSASSHLNRQSTDGLSSCGEGDTMPRSHRFRWSRQTPDLDEEELCEQQLLHSKCLPWSPADTDQADISSDFSQDKDQEFENDALSDEEGPPEAPTNSRKARAWQDEGRCLSDKVVEVVIEASANKDADAKSTANAETTLSAPGTGPRRSSRQSARGKSYALRKKRNRRPQVQRMDTPSDADDIIVNHVDPKRGLPKLVPALSPVPLLLPLDPEDVLGMQVIQSPVILQEDIGSLRRSGSRSPSVVEGTPEPPSLEPYYVDTLENLDYRLADIPLARGLSSRGHDREEFRECNTGGTEPADKDTPSTYILHLPYEDPPFQDPVSQASTELRVDSRPQIAQTACIDPGEVGIDIASSKSGPVEAEKGAGSALFLPVNTCQDEDDDDILLLGATFEDEEDIIWPESKPDLVQPAESHAEPEWPNTWCEMSYKSIKGEKQEITTFNAPFRCSRIIDLTADDLCDEGEHDELDEW